MDKKMKKGFIRSGLLFPIIGFILIIILFNFFFLDSLLKMSLESIGSNLNRAEVNIGSLKTSFKDLSLQIEKVEVTDALKPDFNQFEMSEMKFELVPDALLRGKFVINEGSVKGISLDTKRKRRGHVSPKKESKAHESIVLKNAKTEFAGNIFGDMAHIAAGGAPTDIKDELEENLLSKKYFDDLSKELTRKEKELEERLKEIPDNKKIAEYEARLKKIDLKNLTNLLKAPKIIKDIDALKKDIDRELKNINKIEKLVGTSLASVSVAPGTLNKLIEDDLKNIKNKVKLPSFDAKTIASVLFGKDVLDKLDIFDMYFTKAKEYMPPPKTKEEKEQILKEKKKEKEKRLIGINYTFGTPKTYPLFWLKKALVSSVSSDAEITGELLDVSSDQIMISKPLKFNLEGKFQKNNFDSFSLKFSLDHRFGINDSFKVDVLGIKVNERKLSNDKDIVFNIEKALMNSKNEIKVKNRILNLSSTNDLSKITFLKSSKNKIVDSLLGTVTQKAKSLNVLVTGSGEMQDLDLKVRSNIGPIIEASVKESLEKQIDEQTKLIKDQINREVKVKKAEFEAKLNETKTQINKTVAEGKGKLNKILKGIKL